MKTYWIAFKRNKETGIVEYVQGIDRNSKSVILTTTACFFAYHFEYFHEAMEIGFNSGYTVKKIEG